MGVAEGKPYSRLGEALFRVAIKRHVRGPYRIDRYVKERTGGGPGGSHWSQILYGEKWPSREVLSRFLRAFDVSGDERIEIALIFLEDPPGEDDPSP